MIANARRVVTQIGSLPFDDVDQAVAYSLRHDIPFLPELPARGDSMLDYIKRPGVLSCLAAFKKHAFDTVKVQCVGPATLVMSGYGEDEAVERAYAHVAAVLDGLEADTVILFLDEPALGHAGFDYRGMWAPIFSSFPVVPGVHTCGSMNWDELFASGVTYVSFDASQFDITPYLGYRGGKRIAWGVQRREDVRDFNPGDLLTLPCGMGPRMFTADDCEKNLALLDAIAGGVAPA